MKNMRCLLLSCFVFTLALGNVFTDANRKTFLAPRPTGVNQPMEYTTWHGHVYGKKANLRNRTSFQVTPFFQASTNESEIGEYFGVNAGSNSFTIGDGSSFDISNRDLIHEFDQMEANELAGTVSFRPDQEAWGVRLDFFQDINTPCAKFFLTASAPIVSIEQDMDLHVVDGVNFVRGGETFSIQDFFKGAVSSRFANNFQDPLAKARIDGDRSETGLGDVDVALGHKCIYKKTHHLFINLGITIPTGNKVRGDYLWAPVVGNGRHVGLGGGVDAGVQIWKSERAKARMLVAIDYRYLFEATEERTVGLKDAKMGHYLLAGKIGAPAKTPLFPAANVLTQDLRVKPGSQLEAMVDFSFLCSKFTIDLGYNMFFKDTESVWVKNWTENTYAIAEFDFNTDNAFVSGSPNSTFTQAINFADLDVAAAASPSQFTHKVFGGVGYTFNICNNHPLSVGAGASYEFVTNNEALENYSIWIKGGVSF